jgi:hypothetical protein
VRCGRCRRQLTSAAVILAGVGLGPTCAKRMGLSKEKAPARSRGVHVTKALPGQLALFEGVGP